MGLNDQGICLPSLRILSFSCGMFQSSSDLSCRTADGRARFEDLESLVVPGRESRSGGKS